MHSEVYTYPPSGFRGHLITNFLVLLIINLYFFLVNYCNFDFSTNFMEPI